MRKIRKWLSWRRIYCKVVQQEGSPESLARGVSLGLFVGVFMPMGFQLVVAVPLAFILRANKLLAIMETMVTNPYTSTVIYPFQCWLGSLAIGNPLKLSHLSVQLKVLIANPDWKDLCSLSGDLLLPFFVGGGILALLSGVPGYYITLAAVRAHRRRKEARALKRRQAALSSANSNTESVK